ncbi:MAG: sulfite exporter TauE/SafE family protein [Pseudomonadota bacterium]
MEGLGFSVAGLLVGTAVGATGVGGGSLMTPILILFYGISPAIAVGTDLIYASLSKSYGVFLHQSNKTLDWNVVGWMALGSVPASFATLAYIHSIGVSPELDRLIKITLATAVIVTATFTLFQQPLLRWVNHLRGGNGTPRDTSRRTQLIFTVLSGILVGSVVTISSVGAGVIGMMLLLWIYPRHEPISLVGSDLAHAVLITGIAGLGHAQLGTVNTSMLFWLLVGALPGIWLGSRLGFRLNGLQLKKVISVILLIAGSMTMAKALASGF